MQVLGQSRGWVLRLLNYEDEVFAAVALLLERHSLSNFHATFAESLYGLKRQSAPPEQNADLSASAQGSSRLAATGSSGSASQQGSLLTKQQQHQALLCQVRHSWPGSCRGNAATGVSSTAAGVARF